MSRPNPAATFLNEAEDLLGQVEEIVLGIHPGEPAGEPVNHLFRAFHTIKGSGAMFGFDAVAEFTHHVETVLDQVRNGLVPISKRLIDLALSSKDHIKALLDESQGGPPVTRASGAEIITALNALLPSISKPSSPAPGRAALEQSAQSSGSGVSREDKDNLNAYRIRFRPPPGLMASGANPALLLDELRALGECVVLAKCESVPPLAQLQADQCYLEWEITLKTDKSLNTIRDVFIFVEDESEVSIEPLAEEQTQAAQASQNPIPAISSQVVGAPAAQSGERQSSRLHKVASVENRKTTNSTVRVPSDRLDRLVAMVGEMVMNQSRLTQVAGAAGIPNLTAPVEELERLVAELRDNVLGIRMMPIGTTFSHFKRLVHDLSAELGKEIELVTEGAETELDKTVLDQLGDPLVHLIRNSIDHGIEPADERAALGKPRSGTIRLAAAHLGSSVVLDIVDDGRGLNPQTIRAKAVEKGLISSDASLSEPEILNLIFLPGFSTAKQVTSVSGRGVGMDVVRRQVDALRGGIQLSSDIGRGTTVSLTLPLTLAIIDGLLVEIGPDRFIIPMSAVTENVELARLARSLNNGRNVVQVRGELLPYIRLRELFEINGGEPDIEKIVLVRQGSERVGLVVDRVLGSHQTVIQSLGRFYRQIQVVSGATIMGDGRVALILDVGGVLRQFDEPASGIRASGANSSGEHLRKQQCNYKM